MSKGVKIALSILAGIMILGLGFIGGWYFTKCPSEESQCPIISESDDSDNSISDSQNGNISEQENDIDQIIKQSVLSMSSSDIIDVLVTDKIYYTDQSGSEWLHFQVTPLPENVTDPAYGVMKREPAGDWQMINFGTCCIEDDLPADIKTGLGF